MLTDYPYNLLIGVKGNKVLELPQTLTKDVQAGIAYALFTLEKAEQDVMNKLYHLGISLSDTEQQLVQKAQEKLRHSSRWNYICYGVVGYTKREAEAAKRKGFLHGYQTGFADGLKAENGNLHGSDTLSVMDLPIETMPLSSRVYNALHRSGCKRIHDVAVQNKDQIRMIRNLGKKGIQEVLKVLHSYGIVHTEWELF